MILVTGATGNIGSELVNLLLQKKERVRTLTRDPAKAAQWGAQVEAATGDLDHPEQIRAALAGVDKVFLLAPGPIMPKQDINVITEAERAGVKHLVMVSSLGVEWNCASGPLHIPGEEALRASGLSWTILRPTEFMSNVMMWRGSILGQGAIYVPTGQGRHAMIDPRDIAAVAAVALTTPGHEGKTYALTGPEALRTADVAEKLGAAIQRPVQHIDIPEEAYRAELTKYHLPTQVIDSILRFYALVRAGEIPVVTQTIEQVTGQPARSFDVWARDHAAAFQT